jgi:hypothetical protein
MEERKCPVCHKAFIVPSKSKWAYRKMSQLICSWTCLRALEMKKGEDKGMKTKVPDEVKQEAVRVAIAGGNPIETLEPYTNNPKAMWWAIKAKVKETDPETYAKLPDLRNMRKPAKEEKPVTAADAMAACQDAADTFFGQCQEMGLLKDQPAESEPEMEYKVTGIRTELGNFQYYRKTGFIDWTPNDGNDTASLNLDEWRQFVEDWPKVLKVLGVKE